MDADELKPMTHEFIDALDRITAAINKHDKSLNDMTEIIKAHEQTTVGIRNRMDEIIKIM